MVHSSPCNSNLDWFLFYGELTPHNAYISYIEKSDDMGIPLMDEDLLYESLAEEIRVAF